MYLIAEAVKFNFPRLPVTMQRKWQKSHAVSGNRRVSLKAPVMPYGLRLLMKSRDRT